MKNAADNLFPLPVSPSPPVVPLFRRTSTMLQKCCNDECHRIFAYHVFRLLLIHFIYFFFHSALCPL